MSVVKTEKGVKDTNVKELQLKTEHPKFPFLLCETCGKNDAKLRCSGDCSQVFHSKCVGIDNVTSHYLCGNCKAGFHVCFLCRSKGTDLTKCCMESCRKFYHAKCLQKLLTLKSKPNMCPLHLCLSCYNINSKNQQNLKGPLMKCIKCPTAVHTKDECAIPGSVALSDDTMLCPVHLSPEEHRGYVGLRHFLICSICNDSGDLIYCESCPSSAHEKCCLSKHYLCERCKARRTLHYNEIVWAKIGEFRWWPAKILNPKDIPTDIVNMDHFNGEFPVQFFSTGQTFWTQTGRVIPFTYDKRLFDADDPRSDYKKSTFHASFNDAIEIALAEIGEENKKLPVRQSNSKGPPSYVSIKVNRPVGKVQIKVEDSRSFTNCNCNPEDKEPCGYETDCLNRSTSTECHADVCDAGDRCQNQKFVKRQYAKARPFFTENRGWGLKAMEDIKKDHFVMEYVGDLIDEEECQHRINEKQRIGDTNFYYLKLDGERIIDAGPKGNLSRFMNHSCDPNCETQKWSVNGDIRVGIFAIQDIPAGSEITFDYQMDFSCFEKLLCHCGSKLCSKLIGEKRQAERIVQQDSSNLESMDVLNSIPVLKKISQVPFLAKPSNGLKVSSKKKQKNDVCFSCNKKGSKLITCKRKNCLKSYHNACLKSKKDLPSGDFLCVRHFCEICGKLSKYQCSLCIISFCQKHVGDNPTVKSKRFLCRDH